MHLIFAVYKIVYITILTLAVKMMAHYSTMVDILKRFGYPLNCHATSQVQDTVRLHPLVLHLLCLRTSLVWCLTLSNSKIITFHANET